VPTKACIIRPKCFNTRDPEFFAPFPKNPVIARFFKEIGIVEELGSGIRNTHKYAHFYCSETKPKFEEGDIFRCTIGIPHEKSNQDSNQNSNQDGNQDGNQDILMLEKIMGQLIHVNSSGTFIRFTKDMFASLGDKHVFGIEKLDKIKPYLKYSNPYWKEILEICLLPKTKKEIFDHQYF
jgi:hypothetical protein